MNTYEKLLQLADDESIKVHEDFDLNGDKEPSKRLCGLYIDGNVALDKYLHDSTNKACVLAEELGHYYTTSGDILDQSKPENRKQELRARMWAYNDRVGLLGIIHAFQNGCRNKCEVAEYLDVTEKFLSDALEAYKKKYGLFATVDKYIIYFEPSIGIMEMI